MRTIILAERKEWVKDELESFLNTKDLKWEQIRIGFTYFCVLYDKQIDLTAFSSMKMIYAVNYDHTAQIIAPTLLRFYNDKSAEMKTEILLQDETSSFVFDLRNTGFVLKGDGDFNEIRGKIINSMEGISRDYVDLFDCNMVIENEAIPSRQKKIVLDIYSLLMSDLFLMVHFTSIRNRENSERNFVNYYTQIICGTFLIRAIIEKLILLISDLDPNINFQEVQGSKSIKKSFLKRAKNSDEEITIKFADFLSSLDILDSKYRTPEVHKLGRVIKLLNFDIIKNNLSMVNEIMAYRNTAGNTYNDVCKRLDEISEVSH